jgi:hypothetical protein
LWLVEGTGHTKAFSRSPAEYVHRVLGFLKRIGATGRAADPPKE